MWGGGGRNLVPNRVYGCRRTRPSDGGRPEAESAIMVTGPDDFALLPSGPDRVTVLHTGIPVGRTVVGYCKAKVYTRSSTQTRSDRPASGTYVLVVYVRNVTTCTRSGFPLRIVRDDVSATSETESREKRCFSTRPGNANKSERVFRQIYPTFGPNLIIFGRRR